MKFIEAIRSESDVEGHGRWTPAPQLDDVEGHPRMGRFLVPSDDTDGHGRRTPAPRVDDAEGHPRIGRGLQPGGVVEGHMYLPRDERPPIGDQGPRD